MKTPAKDDSLKLIGPVGEPTKVGHAIVWMVPSRSEPGIYRFVLKFFGTNVYVCDCPGYLHRQECFHVDAVKAGRTS